MARKKSTKIKAETAAMIETSIKALADGDAGKPIKVGPPTFGIEFQDYEIEYLQRGLELLRQAARGPWVQREDGTFWYEETAEQRRITFVSKSISRQLAKLKGAVDGSEQ